MKPLKTVIIGCGMISNIYILNLKNLFNIIDLHGLCDLCKEAAQKKAELYGVEHVMTLEEIEADDSIELVVNLTGPGAHYQIIKRMLLAGKHVFTEKTLASTLEEGAELVELANKKNLYLGVAPDTILGAGIQTAKKLIDSNMIGEVTSVLACVNRNQGLNSEIFPFIKISKAGCFPYDIGVYYVASILALLGPVKEVSGFAKSIGVHKKQLLFKQTEEDEWKMPGNDVVVGSLLFDSGAVGTLHFNGNSINDEKSLIRIYGTEGILELGDPNGFGCEVKLIRSETGECIMPHTHGYDGKPVLENPTEFEYTYGNRGIGVAEMAYAIRLNRKNRLSKEFGYHTMEVLLGMEIASETKSIFYPSTKFEMKPLASGYIPKIFKGWQRGDAELSLVE